MPIQTNLNQSPYWDDYNPIQKYYQVLFQPGVSVQARELNYLQSIIQHQFENFGDNIFSSGTIVSGCNFQFLNPYPYVQLNDIDVFNNTVIPSSYFGYNVENQVTGLQATILNFANGFQTTPPNLKTLYVRYLNTGNNGANLTSFNAGDTLTIYNPLDPVQQININGGGLGFSNVNPVIILSQIICTVNTGTPTVGNFINKGDNIANAEIISVTSLGSNQYAVGIAPRTVDLANVQANSLFWTFNVGDNITNVGATLTMTVNQVVGSGAQASVITNGVGTVTQMPVIAFGVGYSYLPFVTIQSPGNSSGYNTLNLIAQNFLTQIVVASGANTVGNGYAFGVTQGVIYQEGMFLDVDPQIIIVSKYNQAPDNVAVGFFSGEQIINYNIDPSLLDNANGTLNFQAPGADRLKIVPQLEVVAVGSFANGFQSIVQWKAGQPFQQNQQTIYSIIGNEMAQRTEDADGDFVLDPFVVTTQDPPTQNQVGEYFNTVIDPGTAYINGFKVQTVADFNLNDQKGINTQIVNNHTISLNYGNYLVINNMGGSWQFNTGATVSLYDTAKAFTAGATLNPAGNLLGTANMRSLTLYQGQPGIGATEYLLYLFNVQMANGASFTNVQSVAYNPGGANTGIADVVLFPNSLGVNSCILQQSNINQLVFWSGQNSLKNANQVIYTYRTVNTSLTTSNGNASNATIVIDISAGSETFPYGSGALSQIQLQDFYVVPTGADMLYKNPVNGTVVANSSTNTIVANSGTAFASNLVVGDWVYITANSTGGHALALITSISNNTFLTISSAPPFSNGTATLTRVFPQYIPVPFGFRSGQLSGNVNTNENIITLSFGQPFTFSGTDATTVGYNVSRSNNPAQLTKTANRNVFVMLNTSNNGGGTTGPWSLGVPDVFRLRGVYIGNSSVTNTGTNYFSSFVIGTQQNPNFYGLSNLYIQPGATPPLSSNTYILVQFDYFTSSGTAGYYDTVSYLQTSTNTTIFTQDSLPLANLTTFVNSWEVPEVFLDSGTEIDLLEYLDFRPYAANTVAPSTTFGSAPLNPSNTVTLSTTGEKKFPLPSSNFIGTIEGWEGRIDSLLVDQNGNFIINQGAAGANLQLCVPPVQPIGTMKLVDIAIPPYPNLPTNPSVFTQQILNTGVVSNFKFPTTRADTHVVFNLTANSALPFNQPSVYTMADIGRIDRQLQQLQYEVTLNALETNTASMAIPSSINPAQNRQAYGIFTDDFTSSQFSALNDPEYAAIKQGTNIVPPKMEWDLQLFGQAGPPYIQFPIVQQDNATVGGVTDPLGLGPTCALNLGNTVAYTQLFRNFFDLTPPANTDIVNIRMADQATVFDNITTANQTINQWLVNNQYNPYTINITNSFNGSISELTTDSAQLSAILASFNLGGFGALGDLGIVSASDGNQNNQFFDLQGNDLLANVPVPFTYDYNAATQQLIIFTGFGTVKDTNIPNSVVINNIPQAIASTFAQAFLGQITWQQFFATLNVTGTAPSGGQVVGTLYQPPVAFYFYDYSNGVRFDIYQGTTLVASSDPTEGVATCQNLSVSDVALLTGPAAQSWFNDNPALYLQPFQQLAGGYVSYAGKILFNYNPSNGAQFTIRTQQSPSSQNWRWVIAYPIDGASVGCVPVNPNLAANVTFTPQFSTFSLQQFCGNGAENSGQIQILTGFTATWNSPQPDPTTSIVAFDASADWAT